MRCNSWKLGRIVVVCVAATAISSTGCKTGMTGKNLFSWSKKPSAETLAGSGPSATYPVSPSSGQTPTTIASAASSPTASPSPGAATSPYNTSVASSPYNVSNAAQANGYQSPVSPYGSSAPTGPYGQSAPAASSPYGLPSATPGTNQAAYSTASAAGGPSYAPSSTSPYAAPQSTYSPNSSAYGYTAPTASNPPTDTYRPGSTNVPTGYPGGAGTVAPSTYTTPTTGYQTPGQSPTYSLPTATSPSGGGSIYR